jgi:regulator of replication initiation timing
VISLSEQLDDIRSRLEVIAEELADLALDRLKESLAEGTEASEERRITRARRAVEKAATLLGPERGTDDP